MIGLRAEVKPQDRSRATILIHTGKMGEGGGKAESGKWKVESGKWKVESGKWKAESGKGKAEIENRMRNRKAEI